MAIAIAWLLMWFAFLDKLAAPTVPCYIRKIGSAVGGIASEVGRSKKDDRRMGTAFSFSSIEKITGFTFTVHLVLLNRLVSNFMVP